MSFKIERIGIALAAYKPPVKYLFEQLKSIQDQTYKNWICVVGFDSDPESFIKHPQFESIWSDPRFFVKKNEAQLGAKLNFQSAILEVVSRGVDAFACADQDDIWMPQKLEACREELLKHGPGSLVHCDMKVTVEKDGKWIDHDKTAWQLENRGIYNTKPEDFLIRNTVAGAAMLVDASLAKKFPHIPEGVPYHDHWYALVAANFGGVYPVEKSLYQYRQHGNNVLGVREYKGFVSLRDKLWNPSYVAGKLRQKYQWSLGVAQGCEQSGLMKDKALKYVQQSFFAYVGQAFKHLSDDPALARALFARSLGKVLS